MKANSILDTIGHTGLILGMLAFTLHEIDGRSIAEVAELVGSEIFSVTSFSELARDARDGWVNGVPMQWMTDWPLPFPLFIDRGKGSRLTDVDGHDYADFCLGDTGAMFGHASPPVVAAASAQAARGFTHMLPTVDAAAVDPCRECFRPPRPRPAFETRAQA